MTSKLGLFPPANSSGDTWISWEMKLDQQMEAVFWLSSIDGLRYNSIKNPVRKEVG
ncbi:hypothetical protein SAMD00020551_4919 [Mesobacillus selenatarsenatis SF-1]|uniref:Uncharacterized protein n=1 Tax=Mesobacillus selenatarsenatis (strain DSM 18680 / JCM 14380 / FERM P-15431 / SF-1) TaxID=1321606 RepID=A0A0A8XBN1_MESS1|nr:hypothetical protein SAMD00020551_4919 [Mesobacillus selenatarsenatis SF-1]